ncbi:serine hydrolase [Reinekea sp.]|jgi:CubicO group peptidase (beta-lactamase class C family)|uniref:serine hydrolase domain-containing protein n=1 Tax=Reinekea sp. TaxID=1970455 RepID=UPI002A83C73B|nr:serine hydrolase [Reinekea sp.]
MLVLLRKILILCCLSVISLFALAYWGLGYSPIYLYNAPSVATGIGAKLACSGRYVSGYDRLAIAADIRVYSPILGLLDYQYNDALQTVSASLLGVKSRSASFQPGIGCAIDYPGFNLRQALRRPMLQTPQAAWPKGNAVVTVDTLIQQRLDSLLASDNAAGHDTRALLIAHRGRVVAESYSLGIDANTPLLGWSMTKSVNALLLGHLVMSGKANVAENDLFPLWHQDGRADISIRDLLQMTDGLDYQEDYDPGDTAVRMLFQEADAADYMLKRPQQWAPGRHFSYSSGSANLLSRIIQDRIVGAEQADLNYLVDEFFRPLGLTSATFEMDASGQLMGSTYLYATARDWAKVGQLMLNGGAINGARLVSPQWVADSVQPNGSDNEKAYGYQWWLNRGDNQVRWPDLPANTYAARGNREQRLMVFPDADLVVVRLGWSPNDYPDNQNFKQILDWFN